MAQSGYTPIQIYSSSTASSVPLAANLTNNTFGAELAINITDGKLYYKDNSGTVQVLASKASVTNVNTLSFGTTGLTPSTATSGAITVAGTLITTNGGTGLSSYTAGDLLYYSSGTTLSKLAIGTNGQYLSISGGVLAWASAPSVSLTVGSTAISGGTSGYILYNNAGTLGNLANTGTGNNVLATSPTLTTPVINGFTGDTSIVNIGSGQIYKDTSGNVGIGTSSPGSALDVQAASGVSMFRLTATTGTSACYSRYSNTGGYLYLGRDNSSGTDFGSAYAAGIWSTGAYPMLFGTNGTEKARLSSAGGLGIGTTADPGAGAIYATGNITAYYSSDARLKENIKDVDNALDIVCAIGSKTFDWTDEYIASKGGEDGYFVQKSDFGVVAQDVQAVFPQAVRTREDGTLAVDYEKLATLSFGAIKSLLARVEALEAK